MSPTFVIAFFFLFAMWFTDVESTGTLKPDLNADSAKDIEDINDALGLWNTKQDVLKNILPFRNCAQRRAIYDQLDRGKRQDMWDYNFFDGYVVITVISCFFCDPVEYYKVWFVRAIYRGDYQLEKLEVKSLTELLCLLSFEEQSVKEAVLAPTDTVKSNNVRYSWNDTVGDDFGNWGNEMFNRNRDLNGKADLEAAKNDVKLLIEEMKTGFNDHRKKLDEVLAERSAEQAILIMDEFKKANDNKDLLDVIKEQLGGDVEYAYTELITLIREGKHNYVATKLHDTLEGSGTDDINLGRIITYHAEIDLVEIADAYQKKYGESLRARIKEETSGFGEDFLIGFLGDLP